MADQNDKYHHTDEIKMDTDMVVDENMLINNMLNIQLNFIDILQRLSVAFTTKELNYESLIQRKKEIGRYFVDRMGRLLELSYNSPKCCKMIKAIIKSARIIAAE
jgi:hypothetical protein